MGLCLNYWRVCHFEPVLFGGEPMDMQRGDRRRAVSFRWFRYSARQFDWYDPLPEFPAGIS